MNEHIETAAQAAASAYAVYGDIYTTAREAWLESGAEESFDANYVRILDRAERIVSQRADQ